MATENSKNESRKQGSGIDFSKLKIKPQTAQSASVQQLRIPVGKPGKFIWWQVHPGEAMQNPDGFYLLPLERGDREKLNYLLTPELVVDPYIQEITQGLVREVDLRIGITRQGSLFVLPVPHNTSGPGGSWAESLQRAVSDAEQGWIRVVTDQSDSGGYSVVPNRRKNIPDPRWPDLTYDQILERAFGNGKRIVNDPDHDVFNELEGA